MDLPDDSRNQPLRLQRATIHNQLEEPRRFPFQPQENCSCQVTLSEQMETKSRSSLVQVLDTSRSKFTPTNSKAMSPHSNPINTSNRSITALKTTGLSSFSGSASLVGVSSATGVSSSSAGAFATACGRFGPNSTALEEDLARDSFRVYVGSKRFVVFWWMVNFFRSCEIAFLTAMCWLYYWLLNNPEQQVDSINNLTFDFSVRTLGIMNWAFVFIDGLQVILFINSLVASMRARQLTFSAIDASTSNATSANNDSSYVSLKSSSSPVKRAWKRFKRRWIEPLFYIHGKYFDHYFLFREYLEVVSQVYQAYQMSVFIATRWINNLFVIMVFLNCVSTPIIHWLVPPKNVPLRRLLSVVCSAFLNFVNAVVIPFIIFMPYPPKYNTTWGFFGMEYLNDDIWYTRAIRENQQLFITSYVDFCATWMPHWSQFSCLLSCEDLVRRARRRTTHKVTSISVIPTVSNHPHGVPAMGRLPQSFKQSAKSKSSRTISKLSTTNEFLLYNGLWIAGVIVLGIHVASQSPPKVPGCQLQSTPWFVTKSSCVNLNINCYRRQIEGNETEVGDILLEISTQGLFSLILSHCPKLQMPPLIREFHHLAGVDLYNDTIDRWGKNASLREAAHPNVLYMDSYLMRWSSIPDGLLDDQLPVQMHEIRVYDSDLSKLTDQVKVSWRNMLFLYLDFCQLEEFPSQVTSLPLVQLTLRGNKFSTIDPEVFKMKDLQALILSNSSTLSSLPEVLTEGELHEEAQEAEQMNHLIQLELEYTQVREVPTYIRQWFLRKLNANETVLHSLYGTPYCDHAIDDPRDEEERRYQSQVCANDHQSAGKLDFFDQVVAQRPL